MSDEQNGAPEKEQPLLTLTISLFADGRTEVSGPIANKMACYGMLECARDDIKAFAEKQNGARLIAAAPPSILRAVPKS